MSSWSFRRRFEYISAFVVVLVAILVAYVLLNRPAPSCFDNKQNGVEEGVDCGGSCEAICQDTAARPDVLWARAFKVRDGMYNAVAYVRNPNTSFDASMTSYKFTLFDASGVPITERDGRIDIPAGRTFPIFESGISLPLKEPKQATFEFTEAPFWEKAKDENVPLEFRDRELSDIDSSPRLEALFDNRSIFDLRDVVVSAIVFDSESNAVQASQTLVDFIPRDSEQELVFTWPEPFQLASESCFTPIDVSLLIDASGSMNNDGGEPPEPITGVKKAALLFVLGLSESDQVGVITFASEPRELQALSTDHEMALSELGAISIPPEEEAGSTDLAGALSFAEFQFEESGAGDSERAVILLSDGRGNVPSEKEAREMALNIANELKEKGLFIYTIALGSEADGDLLSELSSGEEFFFTTSGIENLQNIYRNISQDLCTKGPAVIDITPISYEIVE